MFATLLRFEFSYQLKQFTFPVFSLLFFAFGLMQGSQGYANGAVNFNAPYQIFFNIGLTTIGCEFVIMFFVVSGILRDRQYQMETIVYSTAVSKGRFFWSRFLGVFVLSLLAFSMCLVGFACGTFLPGLDGERLAPFDFQVYLWTWLLFVLPNIFICTTLLFSIGMLTKNNVATYVSAILLYFLYMFGSMYFNSPIMARAVPASPENLIYAALADPFGLAAFFEQTQFWTPYQKNNQLLSFTGFFRWNRLIWVSFSAFILGITYYLFSFRQLNQRIKKAQPSAEQSQPITTYQPIETFTTTTKYHWTSFLWLLKMELRNIFKSLPFIVLLLVWIMISFINIYERVHQGGAYNDSLYPTTNFLLELTRDPIMSLLLIVFFSGEVVWKVRTLKFNGIIDATPVANSIFFLSKLVALVSLPLIIITASNIISMLLQISKGYFQFEINQYLAAYYFSGMEFLFYIFLSLFVQTLVYNKYMGMLLTGLVITCLATPLAGYLGIEHPLLQLGKMPYVQYTNMNGYSYTAGAFHYFVIYWNALGLILALFAFKLWQRGTIQKWAIQLQKIRFNWKRWEKISLLFLSTLFLSAGTAIYYNINVVNEYASSAEQLAYKENYERKYKQFEALENLTVIDVKTQMDIFPKKGKYTVSVNYILQNNTDTAIQQVFMTERKPLQSALLENAQLVLRDSIFHTRLYELNQPLLPKQTLTFSFELTELINGFESSKQIVQNGSYISQHHFKPMLGYRKSIEIKDEFERSKRGLPKRATKKVTDHHLQNHQYHNVAPIQFETIISTHANQTAIAPGDLIKQWNLDGRNYFHYKTSEKIMESINYFSANYATKIKDHNGVSIEQYYHKGHEYNLQNAEENAQLALDYCIHHFGAYPFNHLRIAEIPGHWEFGGQAMPGTISMVADRFYLIDNTNPDGFDLVAKRTIHEVAHQWWGMLLRPKIIEGGSILIEGFAKYTEAVVMEKKYGKGALWQLSESANRRYFSGRAFASDAEPSLYYSDGENYLSYGKSYTVMLALKELLGEEKVNQVLSQLVEKHRNEVEPTATSLEFIAGLYEVAPLAHHSLIDDWLKRVITYDLKVTEATIQKLTNGQYEVTCAISAKRLATQQNGQMQEIAINEPIPIGIFTKHPKDIKTESAILYLEPQQISKDEMQFKLVVDELPHFVAIDPFGTRLDENRVDNIRQLDIY